jgi:hypothetical protein
MKTAANTVKSRKNRTRIAHCIELTAEHRARLRELAELHNLAQGDVVGLLLDCTSHPVIEDAFATKTPEVKRLKREMRRKNREQRKATTTTATTTFRDVIAHLNELTKEQLGAVAKAAWKMKGGVGDYEETRTAKRRSLGAGSKQEVIEQLAGLEPPQLQTLVRLIAKLKTETD